MRLLTLDNINFLVYSNEITIEFIESFTLIESSEECEQSTWLPPTFNYLIFLFNSRCNILAN